MLVSIWVWSPRLTPSGQRGEQLPEPGWKTAQQLRVGQGHERLPGSEWRAHSCQDLDGRTRNCQDLDVRAHGSQDPAPPRARARRWRSQGLSRRLRLVGLALWPVLGPSAPSTPASSLAPPPAALALPAGPAEAICALCQRAPREPVRADCGHRFCRACVVRFWAEEDGPFPCPECADDCWQRAVEPSRPPLSRRLLALEEAAAAPARDGPASEAALQLLCRADGDPLCSACRMAAGPEPPEWEPRWRKALRGKVRGAAPHTVSLCALPGVSLLISVLTSSSLSPLPHPTGAQHPPFPGDAAMPRALESWSP